MSRNKFIGKILWPAVAIVWLFLLLPLAAQAQTPLTIDGGNRSVIYGDPGFTLTTSGGNGGAVTWQSSDPSAVAVDPATGAVTILRASATPVIITAMQVDALATGSPIPTLEAAGLTLLALLLAGGAAARMRRRR